MTLAAGAIFGLAIGTVVVSFASSIGATLAFLVSRHLLRGLVGRRFSARLAEIDRGIAKDGAFYLYADVSHLTDDSMAWTARLLADTGVALTPGADFDTVRGYRYVRLSFAGSTDDIDDAMTRLGAYV